MGHPVLTVSILIILYRVGIVQGYNISYCPIDSFDNTADCLSGGKVLNTIAKPDAEMANITDLQPWTVYKVAVAVITKAGLSEFSDYLVNRTSNAAPGSGPTALSAIKDAGSANAGEIMWQVPVKANGPIAHYEIKYGYEDHQDEYNELIAISKASHVRLDNLAFNAVYDVNVRACSVLPDSVEAVCGIHWSAMKFTTGIGRKFFNLFFKGVSNSKNNKLLKKKI
jgi:hypothetical protein